MYSSDSDIKHGEEDLAGSSAFLIALSPKVKAGDDDSGEENEEATAFNAETHVDFFRSLMPFYDQDLDL